MKRVRNKKRAVLIDLVDPRTTDAERAKRMRELEDLVRTYGSAVVVKKYQKRRAPDSRTYIGSGKVDELVEAGDELNADLLILNAELKPRQMFLLEERLRPSGMKPWDRIDLILKIFAKHAKTAEAKLEIELASLRHMGPRIYGMGMELSRQGGGIGTSGVGETNTEIMKRHLQEKERNIKEKLEKYKNVRAAHRKNRRRNQLKTVSLVGYTNAGKTTLLNALTGKQEDAEDKLFATLDTRVGKLFLPGLRREVILTDTIGFIQDLPPELLNAFSSTLSEAQEADLLLLTVDTSDDRAVEHMQVVQSILERLGMAQTPRLYVFNKVDEATDDQRMHVLRRRPTDHSYIFVSAVEKKNLENLVFRIEDAVGAGMHARVWESQ